MKILGIETSCDETAAALLEIKGGSFKILNNIVASSVELQAEYGGVVPEIAARKQVEYIIPVINKALKYNSKINYTRKHSPDYIAVTNGPGLITSLRVGLEAAKTLSYAWQIPLIEVNHLEGHIYASAILNNQDIRHKKIPTIKHKIPKWKFPVLSLIVSGGHTQLVMVKDYLKYKIIGETLDDAVGEAFDKTAKILGLGYPGGPIISDIARKGDATKFNLPRPMLNSGDYNFSFSGLKTAVLYLVNKIKKDKKLTKKQIADICACFEQASVDILVKKTAEAAQEYNANTVVIGGGVAANKKLRDELKLNLKNNLPQVKFIMPKLKFSGDNGAMIAMAGYYKVREKNITNWKKISANPNLKLS